MRLFFYACSQYQGDLDIEVSIDDINRILAYQGGNQREIIKNAIPTLMQSALVHIDDENGERWSIAITDSYIKNDNKTVRFTFNKTVQKELEELRGYTWLYLSNLTGMSSTYAVRIYEFFAMRLGSQNKKDTFDFDLNKLRIYLDCTNKLEDFRNFERTVLKKAEKEMYQATNGVNTHKGTIFSMGILISVLASHLKEVDKIDLKILSQKIKNMCSSLIDELENINNFSTYGEKAFKNYHLTGARGLALSGYDIVLLDGINKLKEFTKSLDFETSCILLLFYYISLLDDTNIMNRTNFETLKEIQILCKNLYEENVKSLSKEKIRNEMSKLNDIFIEKNISAGGSADLLILTIFIHFIK